MLSRSLSTWEEKTAVSKSMVKWLIMMTDKCISESLQELMSREALWVSLSCRSGYAQLLISDSNTQASPSSEEWTFHCISHPLCLSCALFLSLSPAFPSPLLLVSHSLHLFSTPFLPPQTQISLSFFHPQPNPFSVFLPLPLFLC